MPDGTHTLAIEWREGSMLPPRTQPPITRTMLALYAGASGDHNPIHIDVDFARSVAKMDDVIGHGMLTMALLGRYLTELLRQRALRSYSVRFTGMSKVGDRIDCSGRVTKIFEESGIRCAQIDLDAGRQGGDTLATGTAVVAIDDL